MYVQKHIPLISFYAVRKILGMKFEGYRHTMYREVVVYTRELFTCMDFGIYLSVKPQLFNMKNVDFSNRQRLKVF